mmetsp:Transcript_70469/g.201852  ORF Transcript_70469/g.201852 Transcript_70469/m.201852 type:complete len:86 (+) Transcript_70469:787-1044(+)
MARGTAAKALWRPEKATAAQQPASASAEAKAWTPNLELDCGCTPSSSPRDSSSARSMGSGAIPRYDAARSFRHRALANEARVEPA